MDFEDAVKEYIEEYGAPEEITIEIYNYLIESGNIYSLIDLAKEFGEI